MVGQQLISYQEEKKKTHLKIYHTFFSTSKEIFISFVWRLQ